MHSWKIFQTKVCYCEIFWDTQRSLFVAYLKRGGRWHHCLIVRVIIRIPKFISFLPLHIRASMEAQAGSWMLTKQCDTMNKQMCVFLSQRMLENGCNTVVWTPEVRISLQMFLIHVSNSEHECQHSYSFSPIQLFTCLLVIGRARVQFISTVLTITGIFTNV